MPSQQLPSNMYVEIAVTSRAFFFFFFTSTVWSWCWSCWMGGLTCIIMFTERSRHRKLCRTACWDLGREFLTCSRVCWPARPWLRRLWMRTHAGKVTQTLPTLMQDQYTRNKKRLIKTSVVTVTKMTVRSTYPQFLFPFLQIPILFWPTIKPSSAPSLHVYAGRAMPVPTITTAEIGEEIPESSNTGEMETLQIANITK